MNTQSNKEQLVTASMKCSQWRSIPEIIEDIGSALQVSRQESKSVLALYDLHTLRPLLIHNNDHVIFDNTNDQSNSFTGHVIQYQLGDRSPHIEPNPEIQNAAASSDFSIPIPVLKTWQRRHNLNFSVQHWDTWTRETYPILDKAGLIYSDTNVKSLTTAGLSEKLEYGNGASATVSFNELQQLSGYSRPGDICAWLTRLNIVYKLGARRRPFTTIKSINRAFGVMDENDSEKRTITV